MKHVLYLFLFVFLLSNAISFAWYNTTYTQRFQVDINNSIGPYTYEGLRFYASINSSLSNGSDLLLTKYNISSGNETEINFWRENGYWNATNGSGYIYVNITLDSGNNTIYGYFNSTSAYIDKSNCSKTMLFCDDFKTNNLDTTKWGIVANSSTVTETYFPSDEDGFMRVTMAETSPSTQADWFRGVFDFTIVRNVSILWRFRMNSTYVRLWDGNWFPQSNGSYFAVIGPYMNPTNGNFVLQRQSIATTVWNSSAPDLVWNVFQVKRYYESGNFSGFQNYNYLNSAIISNFSNDPTLKLDMFFEIFAAATSPVIQDMDYWAVAFLPAQEPITLFNGYEANIIKPNITINQPLNKSYSNNNIPVYFSTYDLSSPIYNCYYSLDGASYVTSYNCSNFTLNVPSSGVHNIRIFSNNSNSFSNSSIVYFSIKPYMIVDIDNPLNSSYFSNSIYLNGSVNSSIGPVTNCSYSMNGNSNVSIGNCKITSFDGLIGLWHMNENSGITISDSSGYGRTCTASAPNWQQGKFGSAAGFSTSAANYVTCGTLNTTWNLDNDWTMTFWFYRNTSLSSQTGISKNGARGFNFYAGYGSSAQSLLEVNNGTSVSLGTIGNDNNRWTFVSIRKRGNNISYTFDSQFTNTSASRSAIVKGSIDNSTQQLTLGSLSYALGVNPFNGSIDDLAIWNRSLTEDEIYNIYQAEINNFFNDTVSLTNKGVQNITVYSNSSQLVQNSSTVYFSFTPGLNFTVTSPTNTTYFNSSVNLEFSYSNSTPIDTCWYVIDAGSNASNPTCSNYTIAGLVEGPHMLLLAINDTFGTYNNSLIYFTISYPFPNLTVQSPANATYNNTVVIDINYSADSVDGIASCYYSIDGMANTTIAGCVNTSVTVANASVNHNFTMFVSNNFGKINYSVIYFSLNLSSLLINLSYPLDNGTYYNKTLPLNGSNNFGALIYTLFVDNNNEGVCLFGISCYHVFTFGVHSIIISASGVNSTPIYITIYGSATAITGKYYNQSRGYTFLDIYKSYDTSYNGWMTNLMLMGLFVLVIVTLGDFEFTAKVAVAGWLVAIASVLLSPSGVTQTSTYMAAVIGAAFSALYWLTRPYK